MNISENMLEIVKEATRKIESFTNISFYVSPIPEEIELENHEVKSLIGNFIGYFIFSEVSAVRFNFKIGLNKSRHSITSCDIWIKEFSLNKPSYTVILNPNSKSEISGGLRTVADMLLGKRIMLTKESEIKYLPMVIREKTQNDVNEFIDAVGIDNIKSEPLSKIYGRYSVWADSDNRRVMTKPQFNRVFKDFLNQRRITSDTISTGHIFPGAEYIFKTNPEEQRFFNTEIAKNKIYYKARAAEMLITRMAQGDPEINGVLLCGQVGNDLALVKKQIKIAGVQKKTVYLKNIYGFAGFLTALWQNRMGKILIIDNADSLFSGYNFTAKKIVQSLLQKNGNRVVQYTRPESTFSTTERKRENINILISEVRNSKKTQPKPNTVSKNNNYDIDDILDSEDKAYGATEEEGIPDNFEFKSKIIFLTSMVYIPEDLKDIPYAIELNYNKEQALSLIEANLDKIMVDFPDLNLERKREILKFMRNNRNVSKYFDYNTFYNISIIYMSGLKTWMKWGVTQLSGYFVPV